MTDTQPTDNELVAFATEEQFLLFCDEDDFVQIARAVLAKWGTPAHSGEPVAWLDPWAGTKVTTDYDAYGKHGIPLYTAPQPTQAQAGAVPLNHKNIEPVRRFLADRGIYLSDETTKALITVAHGINAKEAGNAE